MNFVLPYKKLAVWIVAKKLSIEIYKMTINFPPEEKYGLVNQIRRASISIALNIAEGKGRFSKKEFIHFLYLARGSLYEVLTCLDLSQDLGFISENIYTDIQNLAQELYLMLNALIKSISRTIEL